MNGQTHHRQQLATSLLIELVDRSGDSQVSPATSLVVLVIKSSLFVGN